eukprot:11185979-Lingulodinium_polyedra.AAC.1
MAASKPARRRPPSPWANRGATLTVSVSNTAPVPAPRRLRLLSVSARGSSQLVASPSAAPP